MGAVTLAEDSDEFWGLRVDIGRKRSYAAVYQPDGSAILCAPVRTRVSNRGRTLTVRVQQGCHWTNPSQIYAYVIVTRRGHEWMGEDDVRAESALMWREPAV